MFCTTAKSERVNTESVTFFKRWRKRENFALTKSKCQKYNSGIWPFSYGLGISNLTYARKKKWIEKNGPLIQILAQLHAVKGKIFDEKKIQVEFPDSCFNSF